MSQNPFVVVVWGDSIAAGGWPAQAEHSHNAVLNVGTPIKVINEGQGGMPAAVARTQFDERVAKHKPDLVIIQFGFNDLRHTGTRGPLPLSTPEEFASHLREMAGRCVNECGARVMLFGNHRSRSRRMMPTGRTYDQTRELYNEITRSVAQEMKVPYLDMSKAILTPDVPWSDYVNEDGVHLSPLGMHAYAQAASSAIGQILRGEPVAVT